MDAIVVSIPVAREQEPAGAFLFFVEEPATGDPDGCTEVALVGHLLSHNNRTQVARYQITTVEGRESVLDALGVAKIQILATQAFYLEYPEGQPT